MKLRNEKIYSQYLISTILFYWTMFMFLPLVLVFSYLLNIDQFVDIGLFILIVLSINLILAIVGGLLLFFKRHTLKRKVKAHYRIEYIYLLSISAFSILGSVVLFDFLGGNRDYIANILVVASVIIFVSLLYLGNKYFKFNYIKEK